MHRALIALSAALIFAFVVTVPTNASNHTRKQRRIASVLVWKRAAPQRKPAPLDAVLEEHKKADPASHPAPTLDVSATQVILQQPLLHVVFDRRLSPHTFASVLLL
ncbi:MAG TPA: hypothetical protein VKH64_04195 [Candidatus Binatia bacterium]|nr:hypothetical protein [Candidatus Binatia bacterium]